MKQDTVYFYCKYQVSIKGIYMYCLKAEYAKTKNTILEKNLDFGFSLNYVFKGLCQININSINI